MSWVLFDYGNVISLPQPEDELARLAAAAGAGTAEFSAAYWPHRLDYDRGDLDAATFWRKVGAPLGRDYTHAQIAELSRLDCESWSHLNPGTEALLDDLTAAGHRLALLSNAPADFATWIMAHPVTDRFEYKLFSCFLRVTKPDPAAYTAALDRLDAEPGDVTFVDDKAENVASAAALGLRAIRFTTPAAARDALAALGLTGVLPRSRK